MNTTDECGLKLLFPTVFPAVIQTQRWSTLAHGLSSASPSPSSCWFSPGCGCTSFSSAASECPFEDLCVCTMLLVAVLMVTGRGVITEVGLLLAHISMLSLWTHSNPAACMLLRLQLEKHKATVSGHRVVDLVVAVCVFSFRETCSLSKKRKTRREMLSERRIHEEYAKLGPIRCVPELKRCKIISRNSNSDVNSSTFYVYLKD